LNDESWKTLHQGTIDPVSLYCIQKIPSQKLWDMGLFFSIYKPHVNRFLIDASKEVGLEANVDKTKYMWVSRNQNADQNRDMKIASRSFENIPQFKHLGTSVTSRHLV
jgi:hypothetical protein